MTSPPSPTTKRVFVVAGELSGDYLGGQLVNALRPLLSAQQQTLELAGIGGPSMTKAGLTSLFPLQELAVMGLWEVLPRLYRLRRRLRQTVQAVMDFQPDLLLTIDSPGFCLRLAKQIRELQPALPIWHYVAPSVWAWKPERAAAMAPIYNGVLALLPFEPPYFAPTGLPCHFVGHPIVESGADAGDGIRWRQQQQLSPSTPIICLLAGSRGGEVRRHLRLFQSAVEKLATTIPQLTTLLIVPDYLQAEVAKRLANWSQPWVIANNADKYAAMAASNLGIAASGTVTLELALARVPTVVAYRVHPLTYRIAKRLIKVPFASLINLLTHHLQPGPAVIPELIQNDATPQALADALLALWSNPELAQQQQAGAQAALGQLGYHHAPPPSQQAAALIAGLLA
jgi:lipid-A-disaccharide synthase